jgi:hypothetical protein
MAKFLAIMECDEVPTNWDEAILKGKVIVGSVKRDTTSEIDDLMSELGLDEDDEKTMKKLTELSVAIMSNSVKYISERDRNQVP